MTVALNRSKLEEMDEESVTTDIKQIVRYMQEKLGQKMTAYISGINSPKEVSFWIKGTVKPRDLAAMRIRCAYHALCLLIAAYGNETAKSWFWGSNTRLDGEAPAYVIRHARQPDDLRQVVPLARSFAWAAY